MGFGDKLNAFYAKYRYEYFGFAGVAILGICTLIACFGFIGLRGEPYSILNHYVSELGTVTSSLGWVFNMGLIVGPPAILLFMEGTHTILQSRLASIGRGFGIVTGIGGFFVGVFPGNLATFIPHAIAAAVFFFGGGLSVGLLALALLRQAENRASKGVGYAGLAVLGIFVAFPFVASITSGGLATLDRLLTFVTSERPPFAADAFFEWLTLFSIIAWIFFAALEAYARSRKQPS